MSGSASEESTLKRERGTPMHRCGLPASAMLPPRFVVRMTLLAATVSTAVLAVFAL